MENKFDDAARKIADVLDQKKAEDILLIDVSRATILTETFIICSGNSPTQIRTLSDEVEKAMAERGLFTRRIEGYPQGRWVVLDFGYILVHLFHKEERKFYDIERLWRADGNFLHYEGKKDEIL